MTERTKALMKVEGMLVMILIGLLAMFYLGSCKSIKKSVTEKTDTQDSVRIEYREKIVKVPVVVEVEVPVEVKEKFSNDSTSHLETSFAVSDAKMVWIDGVAFLRHTLANKAQKIQKQDTAQVVEKEKIVWKTRCVTYNKVEIREKQFVWWQKALMWTGGILGFALILYFVLKFILFGLKR